MVYDLQVISWLSSEICVSILSQNDIFCRGIVRVLIEEALPIDVGLVNLNAKAAP